MKNLRDSDETEVSNNDPLSTDNLVDQESELKDTSSISEHDRNAIVEQMSSSMLTTQFEVERDQMLNDVADALAVECSSVPTRSEGGNVTATEQFLPYVPYIDVGKLNFLDILAIWTVVFKIKRKYVTELLKLLQPLFGAFVGLLPDGVKFPRTCETLLKNTKNGSVRVIIRRVKKKIACSFKRTARGSPIPPRIMSYGHYVHFGLLQGILDNSPGKWILQC